MIKKVLREVFTGVVVLTLCGIAMASLLAAFVAIRYANASHFDIAGYAATFCVLGICVLALGAGFTHRFKLLTR